MHLLTTLPAAMLVLLCIPAASGATQTSRAGGGLSAAAPRAPAHAARRKPRIVHLPSPSAESAQQRDRRLARECRGLPNAGACLGYAAARPRGASAHR